MEIKKEIKFSITLKVKNIDNFTIGMIAVSEDEAKKKIVEGLKDAIIQIETK